MPAVVGNPLMVVRNPMVVAAATPSPPAVMNPVVAAAAPSPPVMETTAAAGEAEAEAPLVVAVAAAPPLQEMGLAFTSAAKTTKVVSIAVVANLSDSLVQALLL